MLLIPLGIGSAYCDTAYGWTCNLVDNRLLLDAAPQALIQLRRLGIDPDEIAAVIISHLHGDHVFGFPFILAERSGETEPLPVIGPRGTKERLERLCSLAFNRSAPEKMTVIELPTGDDSEVTIGGYQISAAPTEHTPESLGYLIADAAGTRLAFSGDSAWCAGLRRLLKEADFALVEMTMLEHGTPDHLSLAEHLSGILDSVPESARVLLTHLGRPREEYLKALRLMAGTLLPEDADRLAAVEPAEELREYLF